MGNRLVVSLALLMWHSVAHANSFTVTNMDDSGTGSLRDAVARANADTGGSNSITFSATATGTITLATPLDTLHNTLTIVGPGADKLTIHGSPGPVPVLTSDAFLELSGVTITGAANTGNGGGILVNDGSLVLRDSTITGNTALAGGGIYCAKGALSIVTSTISGNTGTGAIVGGGGITMVDSTIADNTGTAIVFSVADTLLSISRTTISNNTDMTAGGGVGGLKLQAGVARIRNATFSGNTGAQAGDFWASGSATTLTLTNVTAVGGSAPALLFDDAMSVNLHNTVLAGTGTRCAGVHLPTSQGGNLSSDTTCNLTKSTDKQGVDPMLGPLAANGGPDPTRTHAPLAHSPVLNAGEGTGLDASDQRGAARVQFGAVDIGAVEVSEPVVMTQPMAQTIDEGHAFTLSVGAINQNSTSPLTYQWRKDGAIITGAIAASITRPAAAVEDAGLYDVMVTNDGGALMSMAVMVTVTPAPVMKSEPSGGGCCSATSRAGWPDAVVGLGLALLLGAPRRRHAATRQCR